MNLLTTEQYKEYFSCQENTLILGSPHVAMIANFLRETFTYASCIDEVDQKYDRVLIDVEEGKSYKNLRQKTEKSWYTDAVKCLSKNGTLIGAFPRKICSSLLGKSGLDITMIENDKMIVKTDHQTSSIIRYKERSIILDTKKVPILHSYNKKHYDYLTQTNLKESIEKYSLPGKKIRDITQDKQNIEKMGKKGLLIFTNRPSLKVVKLENVNKLSSAADCHLFSFEEERDKYYDALTTKEVSDFAMNMSHYQPINVTMRSYLFNPNIFSLTRT